MKKEIMHANSMVQLVRIWFMYSQVDITFGQGWIRWTHEAPLSPPIIFFWPWMHNKKRLNLSRGRGKSSLIIIDPPLPPLLPWHEFSWLVMCCLRGVSWKRIGLAAEIRQAKLDVCCFLPYRYLLAIQSWKLKTGSWFVSWSICWAP